jgi:hypothetical protein
MAVATWGRTLGTAVGTGVVVGAGQLGVAYGLGILRWDDDLGRPTWHAQLTWLCLMASVSVIAGATAGRWSARRWALPDGLPVRLIASLAAAVGGVIMVPLVLHPARTAHVAEPGSPELTAVLAVAAGLVVGVIAAVAVLSLPTVAGNITATITWLWTAALVSAVWTIGRGEVWGSAHLGLLPAAGAWIPVVMLVIPGLIAVTVAAVARFGGSGPVLVSVSGLAGPALVATAYVVGAPGGGEQSTTYRYALVAVTVAAALSVVVAVARRPAGGLRLPWRSAPEPATAPTDGTVAAPAAQEPRSGAHRHPAWAGAAEGSGAPEQADPADTAGGAEDRTERPDWTTGPPETGGPDRSGGPHGAGDPDAPGAPGSADHGGWAAEPDEADPTRPGATDPRATRPGATGAGGVPPSDPDPEAPTRRGGRRGRRRGQDAGEPAVPAGDSDYVDWVRALGGGTGGGSRTDG